MSGSTPQREHRAPPERDEAERAFRLKAFAWSLPGAVVGFGVGVQVALHGGRSILPTAAGFGLGLGALAYFATLFVADRAGRIGGSIYSGAGSVPAAPREYSLAQSYVARGLYAQAAAEYEHSVEAYPDEPEPCIRLARLWRDELKSPADAAAWFRRCLAIPALPRSTDILITRELVELYVRRMNEPQRALADLARIAERYRESAEGERARRELRELKQVLQRRNEHG